MSACAPTAAPRPPSPPAAAPPPAAPSPPRPRRNRTSPAPRRCAPAPSGCSPCSPCSPTRCRPASRCTRPPTWWSAASAPPPPPPSSARSPSPPAAAASASASCRAACRCATVLAAVGALQAVGVLGLLAATATPQFYAAAAVFGLGIGGLLTLPPVAWADYYGRGSYGAIRGVALTFQVLAQAAGPLLSGVLRDATGNYTLSLECFATLAVLASRRRCSPARRHRSPHPWPERSVSFASTDSPQRPQSHAEEARNVNALRAQRHILPLRSRGLCALCGEYCRRRHEPRPQRTNPARTPPTRSTPTAAELALAYPTPLPHAYPAAQPRKRHTTCPPSPRRAARWTPPTPGSASASPCCSSTIGGVGMWSVVVALPAVQAGFHLDRGAASLPYTLSMVGLRLRRRADGLARRPRRRGPAGRRRRHRARPRLHRRRPRPGPHHASRSPTGC